MSLIVPRWWVCFLTLMWPLPVPGQFRIEPASSYALTGSVDVDVTRGVIAGDLCLHDPPSRGDTIRFALHHGLNVKRVRIASGVPLLFVGEPALLPDSASLLYAVRDTSARSAAAEATGGAPSRRICVTYAGMFPVYRVDSADYRLDGPMLTSLDRATPSEIAVDRYRYAYAPLLLIALERVVGIQRMWSILHALLTSPREERVLSSYEWLHKAATRAEVSADAWSRWESRCVTGSERASRCFVSNR